MPHDEQDAPPPPPTHVWTGTWSAEGVRTVSLAILAAVAVGGVLWARRDVFVPLGLATAFAAVLRPVVRWLREHLRLPVPLGAALILLGLLWAIGAGVSSLEVPARAWVTQAPELVARARGRLETLRRPLQRVTQAIDGANGDSVARGRGRRTAAATQPAGSAAVIPGVPPSALGSTLERVFGTTASLITSTAEVLLLLYFLLAGNDRFLRRLVGGLHDPSAKRTAVEVVREAEAHVARYLGTTLLLSVGQGVVVGLALWALGVPGPAFWGLATAVLENLPYLGAAVMITALAVAGLAAPAASLGGALAPPAAYLVVSMLQNNLVSPIAYGRSLRLNPFAILVAVLAGYAFWGVAGVFLAVPAAAALNVAAAHVGPLAPVGEVLRE